jgi:hypothetical protein
MRIRPSSPSLPAKFRYKAGAKGRQKIENGKR